MSNFELQIKEQMHKAFFDLIDQNVNSEKPDYEWITRLYIEIRNRLCLYIKKDSKTYKQILEEFDEKLFFQMCSTEVFDYIAMCKLINNSFDWIKKLQAPIRDEFLEESKNRVLKITDFTKLISTFLREIHICLDLYEKDMKDFLLKKD
jgi:hypothetical protein